MLRSSRRAGWGVVFAPDIDPAVREALQPLLSLRQEQAGSLFRIYEAGQGYRLGETKPHFLIRHGADACGPADPQRMPYYLLLVGDPEQIPFSFQYQLDVQYAVGRLHFERPEEYANYARTVVEAETRGVPLPRRLSFFGTANPDDMATQMSLECLVRPLHDALQANPYGFQVEQVKEASRGRLQGLMGGAESPALLFTASHGVEFAGDDPRQRAHQGALLCQDWPGPRYRGEFKEDFYFAGEHLATDARLRGMLMFSFSCYGAGTPRWDEFAHLGGGKSGPRAIAPSDFVAALPMRLLGHPRGGCLAFIGHIDRAWGYSYVWPGARGRSQTVAFENVLRRLLQGLPVGYALDYFNERYAELSTVLTQQLQEIDNGLDFDPLELAAMWTANNDARGYIVLGDPAARLRLAEHPDESLRLQEPPAISVRAAAPALAPPPARVALESLPGVGEDDWAKTPLTVQRAVLKLIETAARASKKDAT